MFGSGFFGPQYFGGAYYGRGGAGAPAITAAQVWAYVLPNGLTARDTLVEVHAFLRDLHLVHGLTPGSPLTVTPTSRQAGAVDQVVETAGSTVTVTRQ